ncbi:hypothetical protein ACHAWF_011228 [Thalassiosira exigua]
MAPLLRLVALVLPALVPSLFLPALAATFLRALPAAMAVDRSKFRTCHQTSFCRRHRHGRSAGLYEYKIEPGTVRFAPGGSAPPVDAAGEGEGEGGGEGRGGGGGGGGGGLLSKFSRMLGGAEAPASAAADERARVRGPGPVLTATLVNASPFPSTALTAEAYGNCYDPSKRYAEELRLTVHLQGDGVARVRATEAPLMDPAADGGARSAPRWTADEFVLDEREMIGVGPGEATMASVHPAVRAGSSSPAEGEDGVVEGAASLEDAAATLSALLTRAGVDDRAKENYLALTYGEDVSLMLRFEPFAAYFFRGTSGPPAIVAGTGGLTHFEVRRSRDCPGGGGGGGGAAPVVAQKRKLTEEGSFDADPGEDAEGAEEVTAGGDDEEDDRHGGKEIVGYWEDGLAIYADGTREEKREAESLPEDDGDDVVEDEVAAAAKLEADEGEGRESRRLDEARYDTDGMWDEKFGDHHDTKPHGPMSVGMELMFPMSTHLFGLPEHASSTQLKTTHGKHGKHHYKEPYRLYNLDVFEYELDETMALYGHVPLVVSQSAEGGTAGAFWFNPSETFVDVAEDDESESPSSRTHFVSESGVIDLFLLPGPDPPALYAQYARLTGRMELPPMFALGYHQCRWNYRDEADVYAVHGKFEELDYPYDVLWLDIEHTDGKRYFTWDKRAFPRPKEMQERLDRDGRRMVTIIDPHIKRDDGYYVHKEATRLGLYVKDRKGEKDYDGWCWPGSSSYLDFTTEKVRDWWAEQFGYDRYRGSTPSLFTWNDMNEPSVFNGPEVSMQKDLLNLDGVEHREWHNLYGMLFHRATSEGLVRRNEGHNVRPFVLSRSFFAGSQRHGAIWTGDNAARWDHLEVASPMLLGLNVAALSFVGADVGGFFGNVDAELMTRWMQAGAYQPFFRGHAHHDSKRREPWVFGEETMVRLRRAAMARYALLPYWYTVFWNAGVTGMPVMRTMWMQYPKISELYSVDDQYLIGSDLLVRPVTSAGATTSLVRFPLSDNWYDVDTMRHVGLDKTKGNTYAEVTVDSDIDKIPVYQRGGSVIARRLRLRRSSRLMAGDPYTLYVALGGDLRAEGVLYMDDETTFDHENRQDFAVATFSSSWGDSVALRNEVRRGAEDGANASAKEDRIVERVIVMGVPAEPRQLNLRLGDKTATPLEFQYDDVSKVLVVRKPGVSALEEWTMAL